MAADDQHHIFVFSPDEWRTFSRAQQRAMNGAAMLRAAHVSGTDEPRFALRKACCPRGHLPDELSLAELSAVIREVMLPETEGGEVSKPIQIGSQVAYSAAFLRATGQYTGDVPFARGTVQRFIFLGETTLAAIDWGNPDIPARVNVANLICVEDIPTDSVR